MKTTTRTNRKPQMLTLSELAIALPMDLGNLSRMTRRSGFPCRRVRGKRRFDLAQAQAWIAANEKPRVSAIPFTIDATDKPFLDTMRSGDSTALEISHAAAMLFSKMLAGQVEANSISPSVV